MTDIVERLRESCVGHPTANIPWPHRLFHEAANEIERLRAEKSKFLKAWDKSYEVAEDLHRRAKAAEMVVDAVKDAIAMGDIDASDRLDRIELALILFDTPPRIGDNHE